jgi:hypothetical protein
MPATAVNNSVSLFFITCEPTHLTNRFRHALRRSHPVVRSPHSHPVPTHLGRHRQNRRRQVLDRIHHDGMGSVHVGSCVGQERGHVDRFQVDDRGVSHAGVVVPAGSECPACVTFNRFEAGMYPLAAMMLSTCYVRYDLAFRVALFCEFSLGACAFRECERDGGLGFWSLRVAPRSIGRQMGPTPSPEPFPASSHTVSYRSTEHYTAGNIL